MLIKAPAVTILLSGNTLPSLPSQAQGPLPLSSALPIISCCTPPSAQQASLGSNASSLLLPKSFIPSDPQTGKPFTLPSTAQPESHLLSKARLNAPRLN